MDKTKTSKKLRRSSRSFKKKLDFRKAGLKKSNPMKEPIDPQKTALAILECLQNNDPEGVMEMIVIYLNALNKSQLKGETNLPKSTMYSALKHRNPTIKTLAKIMYDSTH